MQVLWLWSEVQNLARVDLAFAWVAQLRLPVVAAVFATTGLQVLRMYQAVSVVAGGVVTQ